jgi:hypothetical protein
MRENNFTSGFYLIIFDLTYICFCNNALENSG